MQEKSEITQRLDQIEASVYKRLKKEEFRKHGRTLHRFVSGDISQVINFQCGQAYRDETHLMWVNLGIRVPECAEKSFVSEKPLKKYYHEYECNIRSSCGSIEGDTEIGFDLRGNVEEITSEIMNTITSKALPFFNVLSSREAILAHRREYTEFDDFKSLIMLEEAMIYGHLDNLEKAKQLFEQYYQSAVRKYQDAIVTGRKHYLKKGQRIRYGEQDVTAQEDGYVTIYGASHGHIDYLDELAVKLELR